MATERLKVNQAYSMMVLGATFHKRLDKGDNPFIFKIDCLDEQGAVHNLEARLPDNTQEYFVKNKIAFFYCTYNGRYTDEIQPVPAVAEIQIQTPAPVPHPMPAPKPLPFVPPAIAVGNGIAAPTMQDLSVVSMGYAKDILCARINAGYVPGDDNDLMMMCEHAATIKQRLEEMQDELPSV